MARIKKAALQEGQGSQKEISPENLNKFLSSNQIFCRRMGKKNRFEKKNRSFVLASLVFLSFLSLFSFHACTRPEPAAPEAEKILALASNEIAIRNVVKEEVRYFIREIYTSSEWQEKIIPVGAVHKYRAPAGLEIQFQSASGKKEYQLDPGQAYAFRYDEKGELELFEGSHGREDAVDLAPFVPTPMVVVEKMLEMAGVTKSDVLYDLGCGDGRIVVTAARKYGARGVGIDLDPRRIAESQERAKREGVTSLVRFFQQDVMKADFSEATVVALYLLPESNELLRPLLEKQLKPGTRVVSHNYEIPGWEEKQAGYEVVTAEDGTQHTIYLYRR